ncbi:MAG TPA: EfeM/EfeO family lipoprotein [Pseudonocardiaceae bacterium]|nr:EfeM/EfeO family lipoprotein [Pseudonocardiaceae bacterium]
MSESGATADEETAPDATSTATDRRSRRRVPPRPALFALIGLVVVVAIVAVLWPGGGSTGPADAADQQNTIIVSRDTCGQGWQHPTSGNQALLLHNTDINPAEVDLVATATGKVIGEVDGVAPNTTATMRITLGPGSYAVRCLVDDADPITGPAVRITGAGRTNPGAVPVTRTDLLPALQQYQAYLTAGVGTLVGRTDALDAAVKAAVASNNLTATKAAWLPAHLTYETLGAAYDAFGDFDGEINGTAAGLPGGVNDPGFTGFHRLEYGLYHGQTAADLVPVADQLDSDVHGLQAALPTIQPDALDIGLRAHEIIENSLQFELTGQTDYGSGTNLATVQANLTGDQEVLKVLRPTLAPRYPQLSDVDTWSARLQKLLTAQQHPNGSWTPVEQLSQTDREQLDGTLSELTELLAPVATITEPRRVS